LNNCRNCGTDYEHFWRFCATCGSSTTYYQQAFTDGRGAYQPPAPPPQDPAKKRLAIKIIVIVIFAHFAMIGGIVGVFAVARNNFENAYNHRLQSDLVPSINSVVGPRSLGGFSTYGALGAGSEVILDYRNVANPQEDIAIYTLHLIEYEGFVVVPNCYPNYVPGHICLARASNDSRFTVLISIYSSANAYTIEMRRLRIQLSEYLDTHTWS